MIYFGKPHKEIYNMCFDKKEKVLAIGDNLRTDIKGANNLNIDSIFITEGVHRKEYNKKQDFIVRLVVSINIESFVFFKGDTFL